MSPLTDLQERDIVCAVVDAAQPSRTFFYLVILSTLIAAFGLLANSTATVIGAMIVAPLMGPLLGLAMGLVRGDGALAWRSLWTEFAGVAVCLLAAFAITLLVGIYNVDYQLSEIAGRTRPTLYDLAIGFFAGLAGAYATLNPKLSNSIAGVAIAVALVPPLSVSGICLAGSLGNPALLSSSFGAFMMFFANFVTIEMAAILVFITGGLGHFRRIWQNQQLTRGLGLLLALLITTGVFLSVQLNTLLSERRLAAQARQEVSSRLQRVPGASLDSIDVYLDGNTAMVRVVARAPQEIPASVVASLQRDLSKVLGHPANLALGTIVSNYFTPEGRAFNPQPQIDPDRVYLDNVGKALRAALETFQGAELVSYHRPGSAPNRFFLAVRSPYLFDASLVQKLQTLATEQLRSLDPAAPSLQLVVRTSLTHDFTADGEVQLSLERPVEALHERARKTMEELVGEVPFAQIQSVDVSVVTGEPDRYVVQARIQGTELVARTTIVRWARAMAVSLGGPVEFQIETTVGQRVTTWEAPPTPSPTPSPEAATPTPTDFPTQEITPTSSPT